MVANAEQTNAEMMSMADSIMTIAGEVDQTSVVEIMEAITTETDEETPTTIGDGGIKPATRLALGLAMKMPSEEEIWIEFAVANTGEKVLKATHVQMNA